MSYYLRTKSQIAAGLKLIGLYHFARDHIRSRKFAARSKREIKAWNKAGRPAPPPAAIKHATIRHFARAHKAHTLVETGSFYGDTIFALRNEFREIHSVELAQNLHQLCTRELGHLSHIQLHFGDSAQILPALLSRLQGPTVFWLDGHFCYGPSARGNLDTPISAELDSILSRPPNADIILIDDARLFNGKDDYPTLPALQKFLSEKRPSAKVAIANDIVSAYPI